MLQKVSFIDEKNLTPSDNFWSDFPEADQSKPEIGRVQITNLRTGEITKVNNLVLLAGREVLARKLLGFENGIQYNIRYFQVGSGGCDVGTTPSKIGPYDDDTMLYNAVPFADENNFDSGTFKYIHNGKSKLIYADGGNIELLNEEHTINTVDSDGNQISKVVTAKTTLKFTMIVKRSECNPDSGYPTRVFRFNEAALLMVNTDLVDSNIPYGATNEEKFNANSTVFARFTTLNKYLEATDDLKIEWFILV